MSKWLALPVAIFALASPLALAEQEAPGAADFKACQEAAGAQNWGGVIASCEKAIVASPEAFFSHYLLGWAYLQQKNWAKCAENYEQFLRKLGNQDAPEQTDISNRQGGICSFQAGNYNKAVTFLEKAAAKKPNDHAVQQALGISLLRLNRNREAETVLGKVIQLQPDSPNAYYYAGNINFAQQQLDTARQRLTKYLELDPNGTFQADAHFMVGSIIYQQSEQSGDRAAQFGVIKQHLSSFLAAKPDAPQTPDALYILGWIASQEEDNDTAKGHFERFLQLRSEGPQADEARRFLAELSEGEGTGS
jgi:tetratricopeptide (TPR) repeat protein